MPSGATGGVGSGQGGTSAAGAVAAASAGLGDMWGMGGGSFGG